MKIHILIPTFNEAENILKICNELEILNFVGVDHKVLVIDDGSPDQTAEIVTNRNFSKISVLQRTKKSGIGPSYLAGIKQAMTDKSTTHLVTMDADGSPTTWLYTLSKVETKARRSAWLMGTERCGCGMPAGTGAVAPAVFLATAAATRQSLSTCPL